MSVFQSGHKCNCEPGWYTKPICYDHYIIHYILNGKGKYYSTQGTYELQKGNLFLIPPYQMISYQADEKEPWTYYWVGFNGANVLPTLNLCGFSLQSPVRMSASDENLEHIFHQIAYTEFNSISCEYELLGYLYHIFALLIQSNLSKPVSQQEKYLNTALGYIEQNYGTSSLTVSEIAHYVGINRAYLYRIFKLFLQQSVQDYILEFRVKKAKMLLTYTDISIESIAENCGFEGQSYFSRVFNKATGQPPGKYRKNSSDRGYM